MSVDQNSVAKDIRPLSCGRKVVEDPRLASVHGVIASGGGASSPMSRLGFEGDASFWSCDRCEAGVHDRCAESSAVWHGQVIPPPPTGGTDFQVNRGRGDSVGQPSSGELVQHLSNDGSSSRHGVTGGAGWEDGSGGAGSRHHADTSNSGNGLANVEGLDDSGAKKVKFLCSFGGKILPRPSDGMLRYVGGQTRIISTRKGVSYQELMHRMQEAYGQSVVIKYQLPNEDLDALVSVSCDEDVENMMEEYDRLLAGPVDASSSSKLRLFLFSADEIDQSGIMQFGDEQDSGQKYVEAVNGIMPETAIKRKDSVSTVNSDGLPGGGDVTDATPKGQIDTGCMAPTSPSLITLSPVSSDAASLPYLHSNNALGFPEVPLAQGNLPPAVVAGPSQSIAATRPIFNGIGPPDPFVLSEAERLVGLIGRAQPGQCPIAPPMRQQDDGMQVTKPLNNPSGLDSRPEMVSFELQNVQNAGHSNTFKCVHNDLRGRPDYRSYLDPDILSLEFASQPASQISHLDSQVVRSAALGHRHPDHLSQQPDDIVIPPNPFHVMQPGYVVAGTSTSSQHILSNSSSPQTRVNLNVDQQFVPLVQIQTEQFPERSLVGTGVQGNLVYKAPQSQAATQLSGQPSMQLNALHQIPLPDQLICPEGWGGLHSGILPEKATKLEDSYMCQKALSHVHSDTRLQENGYNLKSVYESKPAIHSCYSEGAVKPGSPNWPPRPPVQATGECQATGNWQKSVANNDNVTAYHIPTHVSGSYKFCQMPEEQYDPGLILKVENLNGSGLLPSRDPGIMLDMPSMSGENHGLVSAGPNESASKKFAVALGAAEIENSCGQLNNPAQSYQDVFQSFVQSGSSVKQELEKDAFGLIDASARTGVPFTILGSSSQDSLVQLPARHHPVSPNEGFAPSTYARATERLTEALPVNPSKPMLNQQCKPPLDLNSAPPMEDSMKCKLLDAVPRLNTRQVCTTVDSHAVIANEEILQDLPNTSVNRPHIINLASEAAATPDEKYIKPNDPLATNSARDMLVQNIQPQVSNSISHLHGQPGSFSDLETHCEHTLSSDPWNGLTAPQCISSMYSTMKDMGGPHVLEEDAPRGVLGDLAVPSVGVSFPLDDPSNNDKWEGKFLDPVASRLPSSTCISDPWDLVQDAAANFTQATKPATPKVFVPKDAYKHSFSEICGSLGTSLEVEKLSLNQQSNAGDEARSNNDLCLEHFPGQEALDASVDDPVKEELQAVAEDVATSVLRSSLTGSPILSTSEIKSTSPVLGVGGEERNDDAPLDSLQTSFDSMAECFRAKILEISSSGLPLSEDIGRLQIIKNCDLEELRELGSGTFGTVYHGKWRGSDVAIKRINDRCFSGKPSEQQRMRTDFWNEACKLSDLHHPNVVAFYGVVLDGPGGTVATVTEYMVNGSLRQALHKNNRIRERRNRIYIAMDVAFGMEYLHGKNIVHFDLKSDNLLVNLRDPQRPICKVGDLGLSKVKCQTLISGGVRGTLPWMAPELLNGSSTLVSEKVDVFSFGIVMWELLTGEEPYADLHYGAIIGGIVSNRLRPQVPDHCDSDWKSLMEKCWSSDPSDRPSFTEIASTLRSMGAVQQSKGQHSQNQNQK